MRVGEDMMTTFLHDEWLDKRLKVIKPIPLLIDFMGERYVVCAGGFDEFGYGETLNDAVDDLKEALAKLYWSLQVPEFSLSSYLRDIKRKLELHVACKVSIVDDTDDVDVTVIIPTYNAESVLTDTINSVKEQIGRYNVEILVCDDCSTDGTVELAKLLGAKVLVNEHHTGGPNVGRNLGLQHARGRFIAFLDQDDMWEPDKLVKQIQVLESGVTDVVFSRRRDV
jgi:hypothetical protein